jgi:hypothetical protein
VPAVVADTGPLRYLVLIDAIGLLPRLFGRVLIPEMVSAELSRPSTPRRVREWLAADPAWLELQSRDRPTQRQSPARGERLHDDSAALEVRRDRNEDREPYVSGGGRDGVS